MPGCRLLDSEEAQPAYLEIEEVSVLDPSGSGIVSHDVTDLWISLDGKTLGIFPYPTYVPCLSEQDQAALISIIPFIRENGIASSVSQYPLLQHIELLHNFSPGELYPYDPVFRYRNDAVIRFDERFEKSNHIFGFDADNDASTGLFISDEKQKDGAYSGMVETSGLVSTIEIATNEAYTGIPVNGTAVYLEMDYLSSANVFVGLMGYEKLDAGSQALKSYYLGLKPTQEWKKIYVNLTSELANSGLKAYRVLIMVKHGGSSDIERLYLDNLKLLHF